MKSPFPGMSPYFEACGLWEGFHSGPVDAIYRAVALQVHRGYFPLTASRSYHVVLVNAEGKDEQLGKPAAAITTAARAKRPRKKKGFAVTVPDEFAGSV